MGRSKRKKSFSRRRPGTRFGFWKLLLLMSVVCTLLLFFGAIHSYSKFSRLIDQRFSSYEPGGPDLLTRSLELRRGQRLSPQELAGRLERGGFGQSSRESPRIEGSRLVFRRDSEETQSQEISVLFGGRDGAVVEEVQVDGRSVPGVRIEGAFLSSWYGSGREKRRRVRYDKLPQVLIEAVLSAEDENFFSHRGLDPFALVRASIVNLVRWRPDQGGSTLTQQFVKNHFLTPEKSLRRKLEEIFMARLLERRFSKEEIFELYANEVYLGQSGSFAVHGFGQGAEVFFGKSVAGLTLAESALLAGIIQAPNRLAPHANPEAAKARRDHVLDLMERKGFISTRQNAEARLQELGVMDPRRYNYSEAPYFVDHVLQSLGGESGSGVSGRRPAKVHTTLEASLQQAAFDAVRDGLVRLDRDLAGRSPENEVQGALVAIDPAGGDILAMVGGRDYARSQFNRATRARRQPGSTFKPFVFAAALQSPYETGAYTLSSLILDQPYSIEFDSRVYAPENFGRRYHGPVSLRRALSLSLNVPTVRLAEQVGFRRVALLADEVGLQNVRPYPSLALGAFEVSPLELAQAFTVFANGGSLTPLRSVLARETEEGMIPIPSRPAKPVLAPGVAFLVTSALQSVVDEGTGSSLRSLGFTLPAAGKTGSSDDSWFVGFTPELLCVVWVGYDGLESLGLTGAQAALPVWASFMRAAQELGYLTGRPFDSPDSVVEVLVDPNTGLRASERCPESRLEYFLAGTEPGTVCPGDEEQYRLVYHEDRPLEVRHRGGPFNWIRSIFR